MNTFKVGFSKVSNYRQALAFYERSVVIYIYVPAVIAAGLLQPLRPSIIYKRTIIIHGSGNGSVPSVTPPCVRSLPARASVGLAY
jgi:hypothetical protein